jgi:hypothetical protein
MAKKSKRYQRPSPVAPVAAQPTVFAPEHQQAQALFRIRLKRGLCIALIFAFLPISTTLAHYSVGLMGAGILAMLTLGNFLYQRLNASKCPRCGDLFFAKKTNNGQTVFRGLSFPPVNQCQHCGQHLQG